MENQQHSQNIKKPITFTDCYEFIESMDRKFLLKLYQDAIEEQHQAIESSLNTEFDLQTND